MIRTVVKGVPAWLAAMFMVALIAGVAQASAATQPIEGTWSFEGGQVNVQATGPDTYTGTVVQNTRFVNNACIHPAGEVIWQIGGSGDSYTGTHEWLKPPAGGCAPLTNPGQAMWTITDSSATQETMTFCTAAPGDGPPKDVNTPTNRCYTLTQTVSAPAEPAVPANTSAPSISGTPTVGHTLSCATGAWSNSPTGYSYDWQRNGGAITGATGATYVVRSADAGDTLTCQVTAYNLGGSGRTATSAGVRVLSGRPGSGTPTHQSSRCPAATGHLSATTIGRLHLGMTRAAARHAYARTNDRRSRDGDLFCLSPRGLRIGVPTAALQRTLRTSAQRHRVAGKVAWVTTANPRYALRGVHPGASLRTARRHVRLGPALHGRHGTWHFVAFGRCTGLIRVGGRNVLEVGIAERQFTRTASARRALLASLL